MSRNVSISVGKNMTHEVGGNRVERVLKEFRLKARKVRIEAEDELHIVTGAASISMKRNGDISINGKNIRIKGSGDVVIKGEKVIKT